VKTLRRIFSPGWYSIQGRYRDKVQKLSELGFNVTYSSDGCFIEVTPVNRLKFSQNIGKISVSRIKDIARYRDISVKLAKSAATDYPGLSREDILDILKSQRNLCSDCQADLQYGFVIDPDNRAQLICNSCNSAKRQCHINN
jgi:hypothetical protein